MAAGDSIQGGKPMDKNTPDRNPVISSELFQDRIFLIRGYRVMLSPHLAELYGVENKALLQAVT